MNYVSAHLRKLQLCTNDDVTYLVDWPNTCLSQTESKNIDLLVKNSECIDFKTENQTGTLWNKLKMNSGHTAFGQTEK